MTALLRHRHAEELRRLETAVAEVNCALLQLDAPRSHAVTNALLNIVVARLIAAEGCSRAALILSRLAHSVTDGPAPSPDNALDLTALHS